MPKHLWKLSLLSISVAVALAGPSQTDIQQYCHLNDGSECPVRTYYIQAEAVEWDYAPSGRDEWADKPLEESEHAAIFTVDFMGSTYLKTLFFQYTDDSFQTKVEKDESLGMLGPVIRAEVGEIVRVVFKNAASVNMSMHPHGLLYSRESEGAFHQHSAGGDSIEPGANYDYVWSVPAYAGPSENEGPSKNWMYHSHITEDADLHAGAIGPIVVYRKGILERPSDSQPTPAPRHSTNFPYHAEYFINFMVTDENASSLYQNNLDRYLQANPAKTANTLEENEDYIESNLIHSINGYLYGNLPGLVVGNGQKVRWYLSSFGNEVDLHTVHWHHAVVKWRGVERTVDVVPLTPGIFEIADMEETNDLSAGLWPLHCHVTDHIKAGMMAFFEVKHPEEVAMESSNSASRPSITPGFAALPGTLLLLWILQAR